MSFFKKITSGIGKAVSAVAKDALPIAAAVATGGTSLAVLKPTNTLNRLDKLTGLPTSQLASMYGPLGALGAMGGGGGGEVAAAPTSSQETVSPQALTQPQQSASIYDQITPYLQSFMQSSQTRADNASNSTIVAAQPQQSGGGMGMGVILAAVGALAVGMFLLLRRK